MISLLRGINVGGHHQIKMEPLKALYATLGLRDAQTYIQSGNVVFRSAYRDLALVARRIENGIERTFGFRPDVMVRTCSDLREIIARNPFAARPGLHPSKVHVSFLAGEPDAECRNKTLGIQFDPEELRIEGREMYMYFPNGMARSKLSTALIDRTLKVSGTARNWNTVTKLLEIAQRLEA
jgi:uncharacterized protein (DUF1697 family)